MRNPKTKIKFPSNSESRVQPGFSSEPTHVNAQIPFPIVGVGASAGGLDAISKLFSALPKDSGMAFVIIQHLDPQHESLLTGLLAKTTPMNVYEAKDGMAIQANCAYVIPPAADLILRDGYLALRPRDTNNGLHLPIDLFMHSLAEVQGNRAIAVILSGAGSDGVQGLEAVCHQGGVILIQDPATAKYDSMPRAAIASGCSDFVLSPQDIARELVRIIHDPYITDVPLNEASDDDDGTNIEDLGKILALLRAEKNVDFRNYKRGTIMRRVKRRMLLRNVHTAGDYLASLAHDPAEVEALHSDLLIQVTRFFRDPATFAVLKERIFPEILKQKGPQDSVRIWVAGCSSGQEVYSLAMILLECLDGRATPVTIQIFGTDISEKAVQKARAGIYLQSIEADVSAERLNRFFTRCENGYQINKSVRDLCVFARQDLMRDPPLSRLDVISCRNVLIYLELSLQKKVFSIFHFALNPTGTLVVGSAETPGINSDLFEIADKKNHIYMRQGKQKQTFDFSMGHYTKSSGAARLPAKRPLDSASVQQSADRLLLGRYAPVGVIINETLDVVEFRGDTNPYLQIMAGQPNLNILRMAREGITAGLAEALRKGKDQPYKTAALGLHIGDRTLRVFIEVLPLRIPLSTQRHWAVTFLSEPTADAADTAPSSKAKKGRRKLAPGPENRWKDELTATKAYLHSVLEEKDTALEEMQASQEEVLSSNEELQSINEELQTAKEELQATNEELTTVNEQLGRSNQEILSQMNDQNNLIDSTRVAIIMLGPDLCIRRFTPYAEKMLHLVASDVGRPVGDITLRINVVDLELRIRLAITSGTAQEENVRDRDGRWYSLRIQPYVTLDKKIDGAVLVLVDVDALKRSEMEVTIARDYAQDVLATIRELFLVLDGELRVIQANASFYRTFQVLPKNIEGRLLVELGNGQWNVPDLPEMLRRALRDNIAIQDFEVTHDFATLGRRTMLLNSSVITREGRGANMILLAIEDVTEKKQALEKIKNLNLELEERVQQRTVELVAANHELETFSYSVAHDLRAPLRGMSGFSQLLLDDYGDKLDVTGQGYLQKISVAGKRMGQLIDDLLSLSSLTREKMHKDAIDLTAMAQQVVGDLRNSQKGRDVQVTIAANLHAVGDGNLVHIVLVNLLSNAWKFTSKRTTAHIDVGVELTGPDPVFYVRDDGVGFDMAFVNQLFGVFKRLHKIEEFPGTGIGLATVQRIVRLHGGYVWVKGEVDRGATIYFTLAPSLAPAPEPMT